MSSAQIDEPPSAAKTALIRRFLTATGIQSSIDTGGFLKRYTFPGGALMRAAASNGRTLGEAIEAANAALKLAYERHRHVWQEEYERHLSWEFAESELEKIVIFLEDPVGQHFLEGRWRMDAYIGTNTEPFVEEIVSEAAAALSR